MSDSPLISKQHQLSNQHTNTEIFENPVQQNDPQISRQEIRQSAESFLKRVSKLLKNLEEREGESKFEKILKKVLKGLKLSVGSSHQTKVLAKNSQQWIQFYKNVTSMGSLQQAATLQTQNLSNVMFRGVLSNQTGNLIIADLTYQNAGKILTDKFAQFLIENPDLLKMLESLEPGDKLPQEILSKLGEEIKYQKLTHTTVVMTDEQIEVMKEQALAQVKSSHNPQAQKNLEDQLIRERQKKEQKAGLFSASHHLTGTENPYGHPMASKMDEESHQKPGKPKLLLFVAWTFGFTLLGLIGFIIFKNL